MLAALSGIAKAWESPFNQSKFSAAPPWLNFESAPTDIDHQHGQRLLGHRSLVPGLSQVRIELAEIEQACEGVLSRQTVQTLGGFEQRAASLRLQLVQQPVASLSVFKGVVRHQRKHKAQRHQLDVGGHNELLLRRVPLQARCRMTCIAARDWLPLWHGAGPQWDMNQSARHAPPESPAPH